jgi:hypothetical protein
MQRFVRFQVLTAASMMFRVVFWDVLPCKMIVDLRQTRRHFPITLIPSRAFNEALLRAELHPLDILPHSPDIPLSFFYLHHPPTVIGRFLAYRLSPRLTTQALTPI